MSQGMLTLTLRPAMTPLRRTRQIVCIGTAAVGLVFAGASWPSAHGATSQVPAAFVDAARYGHTTADVLTRCTDWLNAPDDVRVDTAAHVIITLEHATGRRGDADYSEPDRSRSARFADDLAVTCRAMPTATAGLAGTVTYQEGKGR